MAKLRTFEEIRDRMRALLEIKTGIKFGWREGDLLTSLVDILSHELFDAYMQAFDIVRSRLINYAKGNELDEIAKEYGLERLQGSKATGILKVKNTLNETIFIPNGTRCVSNEPDIFFLTQGDFTILPNEEVNIPIIAEQEGEKYNLPSKSIRLPDDFPVISYNINATSGGKDIEIDEELRKRIEKKILGFKNSTNFAIENALLELKTEDGRRIHNVKILEDFSENVVRIYIDDGSGELDLRRNIYKKENKNITTNLSDIINLGEKVFYGSEIIYVIYNDNSSIQLQRNVNYTISYNTGIISIDLNSFNTNNVSHLQIQYIKSPFNYMGTGNEIYLKLPDFPVIRETFKIYKNNIDVSDKVYPLSPNPEYFINCAEGILISQQPLENGAIYDFEFETYTDLIKQATIIIYGDLENNILPVKPAGVYVQVFPVGKIDVDVLVQIRATTPEIQYKVSKAIVGYFGKLGIGDNVIPEAIGSEIMKIEGVISVNVLQPSEEVQIPENKIAKLRNLSIQFL